MKNKFIKTLVSGVLCLSMLLGVTACGDKGDPNTIRYGVWGSADELALYNEIISGFESLYAEEGYKVKLVPYSGEYYDTIKLEIAGKNEPDIFFMQGGSVESYIKDGNILNLQPYIEAEYDDEISFTESDLWAVNDGYRYNETKDVLGEGDLYVLIKDWSPDFAMLYNKDLIDQFDSETGNYSKEVKQRAEDKLASISEAQYKDLEGTKVVGRTLAEIVGYPTDESGKYPSETIPMSWRQNELMCFLLTVFKLDNQGRETSIKEVFGTNLDKDALKFAQMYVEMTGASLYSEDGKSFNYSATNSNTPTAQKIEKAYQHFINYQTGLLASSDVFGATSTSSDTNFPKGDVAVVWYGRWKCAKPTWQTINMGYAPPPTETMGVDANNDDVEDNGNVYCSSVAIGHAISSRSKNPDLAYKFLRYYMTVGLRTTLNKGFNIPGNKTIALSDAFQNPSNQRDAKLNKWYTWLADYTHPLTFSKYVDNSVPDGYLTTYLKSAVNGTRPLSDALRLAGNEINKEINTAII